MVPKGWERKPIKEVCESIIDCVNKTAATVDFVTPYKMLRTTNVRNGRVNTVDVKYVTEDVYLEWTRRGKPKKGDLIFTREAPVGEVGVLEDQDGVFLGQRTMMYRTNLEIANNYYLFYSLQSRFCQKQIEDFSNGGTVEHMRVPDCGEIIINVPPISEQNKIAKILSVWDKAITTTEKLLANSQQQKKALMQKLLTGKVRLLDENGVRFNGERRYVQLGELGSTYTGLTGKSKEDFGAGKPYIPYMNIFKNSRIDINNLEYVIVGDDESQSKSKYGDIFFTTSSETPDEVGMSSVLLDEVGGIFLNSFCFGFRLNNFTTLTPEYARYLFRSEHVRRQISILGQGATRYNLSKKQLLKIELELPSTEEQRKVAHLLSAADQEINLLQAKLNYLKQEKKALMQQLLTGKRRVKTELLEKAKC